jgi:hypothetical protein
LSSDESRGFRYEDDEYESDEPTEKKIRLEQQGTLSSAHIKDMDILDCLAVELCGTG